MNMRFIVGNRVLLTLAFASLGSLAAQAMNVQLLHSFDTPLNSPWAGLVQAGDGNFYGVTDEGGSTGNGSVFRVAPDGTSTLVHQFLANEGSFAEGRLALGTNGWLYGTTYYGGPANAGTVFKVSTNGNLVTLASFNGTNGLNPQTGMTLGADGYFYGTTYGGGAYGQGALYKVSDAGDLQLVFSFSATNGANPGWNAELCLANDGNLYGTTRGGGPSGNGVIFKVDATGAVSTLVDLGNSPAGTHPFTGLVQGQDGLLYGSTEYGGSYNDGSFFNTDLFGNVTNLGSFDLTNAVPPESTMIQANDGNFYATSSQQVIRFASSGGISVIYQFSSDTDADLEGRLMQGPDGYLYGTSYDSAGNDIGFVYRVSLDGSSETEFDFLNPGGSAPQSVAWGSDGNIYGTCAQDGMFSAGTLFRVTPGGSFTNLHSFDNTNGNSPNVLISGNDGNLYGTAEGGGIWGGGTVFQITTNGVLTSIGSLDGTNGSSPLSLVQATDGNFYGATLFGGPTGDGVVFKLETNGLLSTLHAPSVATGNYPAGVMQGQDGSLYGVAENGPYQGGLVWKLSLNGDYNILYAFTSAVGYFPGPKLVQDAAGLLYGGMVGGSQPLFCLAGNGSLTNIGTIPDYYPYGMFLGADGNFYGASWLGGTGGQGSVWVMNRNGRLARLISFDGSNGGSLRSGPILGGDGRLYGCAEQGGPGGGGVIYAITMASPEIIAQPISQSILTNGTANLDVIAFSTNSVTYQWFQNGQAIPGATNVSYSVTNAQGTDFGNYSVAVTSGGTTVVSSNATLTMLPDKPLLAVQQQQANIVLSWPAAYIGFSLQQSTHVAANLWQPVANTPASNAQVFSVTIPISPSTNGIFYRLQK